MEKLDELIVSYPLPLQVALSVPMMLWLVYFSRIKHRDLFDKRKTQVDRIDGYLAGEKIIDPVLFSILEKERDEQIFAHVYGYRLDSHRRNLLEPIVNGVNAPVTWWAIKNAREYIRVESEKLSVQYSWIEKWGFRVKVFLAPTLYLLMLVLLPKVLVSNPTHPRVELLAAGMLLIMFTFMSIMVMLSCSGFATARNLEKWLIKDEKFGIRADARSDT